jgi:hypothetical protein
VLDRPPLRVLIAVALVTGCTLAFQVVLTRVLAATLAYHFSFLAISLGLLGTGAGALAVYVWPARFRRRSLEHELARWSVVYAALLIGIPFVLVRLDLTQVDGVDARFVTHLAVACLVAALPSLAAGIVVALAISGYTERVGVVYAFDLVGAGLGALLIVPVLWLDDAPTLLVALGVVAATAALMFGWSAKRARGFALAVGIGGVAVVTVSAATSVLYLPPRHQTPDDAVKVADRWNPLSRVVGYDFPSSPTFSAVFYDQVYAPVPIVAGGEIPGWEALRAGPQSVGYELTGPGRALVIGGGGGRDIYAALAAGQEPVDVIELNEGIRRVVDDDLGDISGSPYSRPGVHTTVGDGRSVLAERDTRYDQIHIGFTDTLSANAAQGYALTENNLYTIEAFGEYLDHLEPDGVLNVSRLRKLVGDEAIRVTVLALAALEREGVDQPEDNVVVILGKDVFGEEYGTVLARREPYTAAELARIRELAATRGEGVAFAPAGPYVGEWAALAEADGWRDFCEGYELDVCPPTDDRPFFFNMTRIENLGQYEDGYIFSTDPFMLLLVTLGILMVLSVVAFVVPLLVVQRASRPSAGSLVYFAAIGLGFLLLEIVLIQRFVLFLGFPTYALSIVLFSLLLFTGVGSQLSTLCRNERRAVQLALAGTAVLIALGAFGLQPFLRALIDLPFALRVVIAIALMAPAGVLLGMAMPIGLRRFVVLFPDGVPFAWGVNGIASVLGSVLGVALAISFGFTVATLAACACYLAALAHATFGRWAARNETQTVGEVSRPDMDVRVASAEA